MRPLHAVLISVMMACYPTGKMGILLGDFFPNFAAETTHGNIKFYDWVEDKWAILLVLPHKDYTPVGTTELGYAEKMKDEFVKRNVRVIALAIDSVENHMDWIKDIQKYNQLAGDFSIPIIADPKRELATKLLLLDPDESNSGGLPLTAGALFIVGPGRKLQMSLFYPANTGRNFDEILRVLDSLQLTMNKKVATPANWKSGERCMVDPSVKQDELNSLFPKGVEQIEVPSGRSYLRFTPDPSN